MRKRDVAIVLLSCFGLFLSLEDEGAISFRKAWFHSVGKAEGELTEFEVLDLLPPPLVVDLNGDGSLEVVALSHDYSLQLIKPAAAGRAGDGFAPASVAASVSLLPSKVALGLDRRPVALAAGYIDPEPRELVVALRKQIIVVVTEAWHVMAFDHNLALLWEGDVDGAAARPAARVHEVAVAITPQRVRAGDRGLVVVGGDVALGRLEGGMEGGGGGVHAGGGGVGGVLEGVLREELRWEEEQETGRGPPQAAGDKRPLRRDGGAGVEAGSALGAGADGSRHFDYYAFEGGRGEARWSHRAGSFQGDELEAAADELVPQANFKLDAEKLAGRHYGELSCREFRASILRALPHHWSDVGDTRMEAGAFVRHREGQGAQKARLATGAGAARGGGGAGRAPARAHTGWLFGSRRRGSSAPGASPRLAPRYAPNASANALVTHLQQGLEVVHLFTGRTLCKLHLPPRQLHVDLNGDGVIDHVALAQGGSAAADSGAPLLHHVQTKRHTALGACQARATSGIPPNEELWTADVCARRRSLDDVLLPGGGDDDGGFSNGHGSSGGGLDLSFAPPAFLPVARADGSYSGLRGAHGIVAVLSSDGVVTAISMHGARLWQRFLEAGWDEELTPGVHPTLLPLPLRRGAVPAALLAVGSDAAVVVSEHGAELARVGLPFTPLAPPVVADFNGDGLNDLLLVTSGGLFGYVQVQHLGGLNLGALLLALIVAMGIVWWGAAGDAADPRARKLRSTDVD